MVKPLVQSCCGCCDLETGGRIIGWLSVIGCSIVIITLLVTILGILFTPIPIIFLVIYILLLIGIDEQKSGKILPAVVGQVIVIIGLIASAIDLKTIESAVFSLIFSCLNIYITIILISLYIKIRDNPRPTQGTVLSQFIPVAQSVPQGQFVQGQYVPVQSAVAPVQYAVAPGQYPGATGQYVVPQGQYAPTVSRQYVVPQGQYAPVASGQYPVTQTPYTDVPPQYPVAANQYSTAPAQNNQYAPTSEKDVQQS